ncbi:MAG: YceI family protein [Bacteroidetes bacterium]|nr:MAG: YceI family protein [Bacteroidota bacterium]
MHTELFLVRPILFRSFNYISMQRNLFVLLLLSVIVLPGLASAQKLFTRDAQVYFDATSPDSPERVDATNKSGTMVLDLATGRIQSSVLMKNFIFEKALMQEHFNENYVESTKYPKATFKGQLDDLSKVNFKKDGTYTTAVTGDLTIHGVTKAVKTNVIFTVKGGKTSGNTEFSVVLADYDISVPSVVSDKLSTTAKIKIDANLEPLNR